MVNEDQKPITGMKIAEVAKQLGVSSNTVRIYIKAKELRATKIGRGWRVTEEDLKQFIAKRSNIEEPAA